MVFVAVLLLWLIIGAAVGVFEARRGHWRHSWVVSMLMGPFALLLALGRRDAAPPSPVELTAAQARRGPVSLLLGFDGSQSSMHAAALAIGLFGARVRRVTLATVLDVDTAGPHTSSMLHPEPWPEEHAARNDLDEAVWRLEAELGVRAGSVILAGSPADALEHYAVEQGFGVVVVGTRGKGLSKVVLGSCASTLARKARIPVMLIPAVAPVTLATATTPSRAAASR